MNYYIDTEFHEYHKNSKIPTIDLISIGIVSDDNREFYAICSDETPDEYNKKLEAELLEDQTLYKGSNPWGPRRGYTPYVLRDGKECWRGEEFRFDTGCSRQSSAQSKELYNYVWNEFFMKEINFGM